MNVLCGRISFTIPTDLIQAIRFTLVRVLDLGISHFLLFIPFHHRLCALHNQVNKRLKKPDFDCAHLSDAYDCGCGDSPNKNPSPPADSRPMDLEKETIKDDLTDVDMIRGGR